jgi:hypothetical protein
MGAATVGFNQGLTPLRVDHNAAQERPPGMQVRTGSCMPLCNFVYCVNLISRSAPQGPLGLPNRFIQDRPQQRVQQVAGSPEGDDVIAVASTMSVSVSVNISPPKVGELGEPDKKNKTTLRGLPKEQLQSMCKRRPTIFPSGEKMRWPFHGKKDVLVERLLGDPFLVVQEPPRDQGGKPKTGEDVPWPDDVRAMVVEEVAHLFGCVSMYCCVLRALPLVHCTSSTDHSTFLIPSACLVSYWWEV